MLLTPIDLTAGLELPSFERAPDREAPVLGGRLGHVARLRRARHLLAWEVAHVACATALLVAVAGSSRALAAAAVATALGVVAPAVFAWTARLARRPASAELPSGWHRAATLGYLAVAVAIVSAGVVVAVDGAVALARGAAGAPAAAAWRGVAWPALVALAFAAAPALALARAGRELAGELHDKVLHADADRLAALWAIAAAAGLAVVAAAAGAAWADAAAAIAIGALLVRAGGPALRDAAGAVIERLPRRTDRAGLDPVIGVVLREIAATPWVTNWQLRLREHGPQVAGEILVEAPDDLPAREVVALTERLHRADWRLELVAVAPARGLPPA